MVRKFKKHELIAPAGNFEKLVYAIEYGADAVYAGVPGFSLRSRINTFNDKNIIEGIKYVHQKNKKIYITANIFAHNRHIKLFEKHLKIYKDNLPDAFIVSDVGILQVIRNLYPDVKIHFSTQANTTNWKTTKYWFDSGVKRIVLARELNIEEIKEIHRKVPKLELEYFVHGAMCMSYSGRCLLSSWQVGKSANLGDCAQNCRWQYQLMEQKRPNEYIPIEQDEHGTYLLNSKDLCLIEYLDELKNAGITSFKIEGRAKSVYYLSQVVKTYRKAIDLKGNLKNRKTKSRKLRNDLKKLVNRTFTTGFLFDECKFDGQEIKFSHTKEKYKFVGEVLEIESEKIKVESNIVRVQHIVKLENIIKIKVHNFFNVGDKIEFIQPNNENISCKIKNIYDDKTLEKLKSAHGGQNRMVYIEIGKKPKIFSIMRKK